MDKAEKDAKEIIRQWCQAEWTEAPPGAEFMEQMIAGALRARDEEIAGLKYLLNEVNKHVMPGTADSADSLRLLIAERDAAQAQLQDARALLAEAEDWLCPHTEALAAWNKGAGRAWCCDCHNYIRTKEDATLIERIRAAHIPEREESAAKQTETRQNSRAGRKDGGGDIMAPDLCERTKVQDSGAASNENMAEIMRSDKLPKDESK